MTTAEFVAAEAEVEFVDCVVDNDYEIATTFPYIIRKKSNGKIIKESIKNSLR